MAIHGLWWQSRFHIWGERADTAHADQTADTAQTAEVAPRRTRRGRRPPGQPPPHPEAMTCSGLQAILGELCRDGLLASAGERSCLLLWLPSRDGRPLSSAGPASETAAATPSSLCLFDVPTLSFAPDDAVDLVSDLSEAKGGYVGDSLRYWGGLAWLVLTILARRHFLPDIVETPSGGYESRWRPLIDDPAELAWLEQYAQAMPPICRAAITDQPEHARPDRIIDTFLSVTTDAVVDRMLQSDSFFRQTYRRSLGQPDWEMRWLSALLGRDRTIPGTAEEADEIAARVRTWLVQAEQEETVASPRLIFTLVEHADAAAPHEACWQLRFELRSADGQERLDLSRVWTEPSTSSSILARHLAGRRRHLLAGLSKAAEAFPALRKAIAQRATEGLSLTTAEAHAFLRNWAPLLRDHGFEVHLPEWAMQADRPLGLMLNLRPLGEAGQSDDGTACGDVSIGSFGLHTLLAFDWRVAVGDDTLSLNEFDEVVAQGEPLVKVHGRWVDVDRDAAKTAVKFARARFAGRITLLEALRLGSGTVDEETGLPIIGLSGESWVRELLAPMPEALMEVPAQPEAFHGQLRPYQRRGLAWLAFLDHLGLGACLADDMGLGKTIQLIALLLHERQVAPANTDQDRHKTIGPTLLFAPMSVVGNWEREVNRFGPSLRVLVHHGPERLLGESFIKAAARHDLVITTYGLAQRDFKAFSRLPWHRIVLDEAQKIKNPNANQTLAICSLQSPRRVALTGTPVENHLSELWSIMQMLNPDLLGSAAAFRSRFSIPIEKLGDQQRVDQLRRLVRPLLLRRLKTDPSVECDLPEKMEMRVYCNLTPEQAAHYQRLVREMLKEVDGAVGIRRRGLILATLTRLKQACNHPEHLLRAGGPLDGRSGKCERLVEMLEETLEEGDAALVFTQYREMGNLLERMLSERLQTEVLFMHGGTSAKRRDALVDRFQNPGDPARIFLLSLKTGGFGLNLTRANHVFHFDRWWNPAVENQATDRAHRIGQTRRVQVHKFVCIGTIEDRIDALLTEKSALADRIIAGGDDWLTGLSTTELREYLTLSPDSVAEE